VGRPSTASVQDNSSVAVASGGRQNLATVRAAQCTLLAHTAAHRVRGSMQTFDMEGKALAVALARIDRAKVETRGLAVDLGNLSDGDDQFSLGPEDLPALFLALKLSLPLCRHVDLTSLVSSAHMAPHCFRDLMALVNSLVKLRRLDLHPERCLLRPEQVTQLQDILGQREARRLRRPKASATAICNDADEETSFLSGECMELLLAEDRERIAIYKLYIAVTAELVVLHQYR
jgi:hypothetical protein